jgi:hypothetical protein
MRDPYDDGFTSADVKIAEECGWLAYHAGRCDADNPYPFHCKLSRAWLRGLHRAHREEAP